MKKWIYRVVTIGDGEKTTYEYDKEFVDDFRVDANDILICMKSGALFGFNRRYVVTWRLIEVDA